MHRMMKYVLTAMLIAVALVAAACGSAADTASKNLGKAAEQFRIQRRIVVTNTITDKVLLVAEGRCSVEDGPLARSLEITCKQSPSDYRKHFVGLADNVTYTVTQLKGIAVNEYRTKFIFRPQSIVPDFDLVTGDQP